MKHKRNILILTVLAIVFLAVGAFFMLPSVIESEIETRMSEKLSSRGIEGSWESFHAGWGGNLDLRGLQLEAPGFGTSLRADEVRVRVSKSALLSGEVQLEHILLRDLRVDVDVEKLPEALGRPDPEAPGGEGPKGRDTGRTILARLLEEPPPVDLREATLVVRRRGKELVRASAPAVALRPSENEIVMDASGEARLVPPGLPEFLRESIDWTLEASFAPEETAYDFALTSPDASPLVELQREGVFALQIGEFQGRGSVRDRKLGGELSDARISIGETDRPGVDLRLARFLFDADLDDRDLAVHAIDPSLFLTPAKFATIQPALKWARMLAGMTTKEAPAAPGAAKQPGRQGGVSSDPLGILSGLIARTDITITRMEAGIQLEEEDGSFHSLTLLERFDAEAEAGRVLVHGSTAGGTFTAEATFVPGEPLPHRVFFEATGVQLEEIPGMPGGRSGLPNRGTSGRIEGTADLKMAISMPPLGIDGPITQPPAHGYAAATWENGVLDLTGVSSEPLKNIDSSGHVAFRWTPQLSHAEAFDLGFAFGPVEIRGTVEAQDLSLDPTFTLRAESNEFECEDAIRAIPAGLLGPYRKVELEGVAKPTLYLRLPLYDPRGLRLKIDAIARGEELCSITGLNASKDAWPEITVLEEAPTGPHPSALPLPEGRKAGRYDDVFWLNLPFIKPVTEGVSEEAEVRVGPGLESYVPLHELPGYVGGAAYLSEEMMFYEDPAISVGLIAKALRLNLEKGRFVYGGSTVTQQLVKNLFLSREKTLSRKFQEALISWRITDIVSKDRVLELYLNCIEFGPDVYGIGPAANFYFQKDARDLTAKEAIFLAMLKPAPWFGAKVLRRGKSPNTGWWASRYEELYQRLIDRGLLTEEEAEAERPYVLYWDDNGDYQGASEEANTEEVPIFLPLDD